MTSRLRGALFSIAQRVGRSLMRPIAVLPAAAIMARLGQPDMLGADGLGSYLSFLIPIAKLLDAAGSTIFSNLPLLFAIGVAIGFARSSDGSTALAAVVGFFTYTAITEALSPYILGDGAKLSITQVQCLEQFTTASKIQWLARGPDGLCGIGVPPLVDYGVFGGITIGIMTALLWQRFYRIRLPEFLSFFGGRRFVPIVTAAAASVVAVVYSFIYPLFDYVINGVIAPWMLKPGNDVVGGFIFGTGTRLLIPFGLHHLLNAVPWLSVGTCTSSTGAELHGDIACFLNGTTGSFEPAGYVPGAYMTGFFPIMMGGLVGAAFAIYRCAPRNKKRVVKALMVSAALTTFFTGVTEPIEFSFAYVAAPLFLIHALLTGSAMALTNWLGIRDGFSFSAGVIDYALNFTRSAELSTQGMWGPILLLALSVAYGLIYYLLFSFTIRLFNIPTPGREALAERPSVVARKIAARRQKKDREEPDPVA